MENESVTIRPAQKSDEAFIFRSVLMGTYHGNKSKAKKYDSSAPVDYFSSIPQADFMAQYHKYVESILNRITVAVIVACLTSDPDVILGFSIVESNEAGEYDTLHFIFVKPDWRGIGIAKSLVPMNIKYVTGFTRTGDIIRRKKNLIFNPWK